VDDDASVSGKIVDALETATDTSDCPTGIGCCSAPMPGAKGLHDVAEARAERFCSPLSMMRSKWSACSRVIPRVLKIESVRSCAGHETRPFRLAHLCLPCRETVNPRKENWRFCSVKGPTLTPIFMQWRRKG